MIGGCKQLLVAVGEEVEHEGHDLGEVAVHLLLPMLRLQVPATQQSWSINIWMDGAGFFCTFEVLLMYC